MTTFQDPPPQSRRAVRQSERGESAEATVGFPSFVAQPAESNDWDTTQRRVSQLSQSDSAGTEQQGEDDGGGSLHRSPTVAGRRNTCCRSASTPCSASSRCRPCSGPSFCTLRRVCRGGRQAP